MCTMVYSSLLKAEILKLAGFPYSNFFLKSFQLLLPPEIPHLLHITKTPNLENLSKKVKGNSDKQNFKTKKRND